MDYNLGSIDPIGADMLVVPPEQISAAMALSPPAYPSLISMQPYAKDCRSPRCEKSSSMSSVLQTSDGR